MRSDTGLTRNVKQALSRLRLARQYQQNALRMVREAEMELKRALKEMSPKPKPVETVAA